MNTCGVLLILFIVLKILEIINWSWWWVLCPLWIPFAAMGVFLIVVGIIALVATLIADK